MSEDGMGYDDLVDKLRQEFGMHFRLYDTSGGNYCLRASTETGHWLHLTDAHESLSSWYERDHAWRKDATCYGFGVSVFADDECGELVYANADEFAVGGVDVLDLVRDALEFLAGRPPSKPIVSYRCYPNGIHQATDGPPLPTTEVDAT